MELISLGNSWQCVLKGTARRANDGISRDPRERSAHLRVQFGLLGSSLLQFLGGIAQRKKHGLDDGVVILFAAFRYENMTSENDSVVNW